jgi:hypothetical protein
LGALEDLLVDGRELDRELVGTLLRPFLRIDRRSCAVLPRPAWERTPNEGRVLLYLVARKAMRALELPLGREAASPAEIERATGIPGGSVRPALRRLLKARLVERDMDAGYVVPNYAMLGVQRYLGRPPAELAA